MKANELNFNTHPSVGYTNLTVLTKGDKITFTAKWNKSWIGPELHLVVPVGTDAIVFECYEHFVGESDSRTRQIDMLMYDIYQFRRDGERHIIMSEKCDPLSQEYKNISAEFNEILDYFIERGYQKLKPKEIA